MKTGFRLWLLAVAALGLVACSGSPPPAFSAVDLAIHNHAVGLMGQYQYDAAYQELARLAERYPDNAEIRVDMAIVLLNRQLLGDEAAAMQLLEQVLEQEPQHLRAQYCSGLLALHAGRASEAMVHFGQVARADPGDVYAAYYYAASLAIESQHETALQWYRRVIADDPYLRSAYYGAFQALRQLGSPEEAREMLDAYQKVATNPRARLAEFKYTRMGPKAEVTALRIEPGEPGARPAGPLFAAVQPLPVATGEPAGRHPAERTGLTVADIDGDGRMDLFATGVRQDDQAPNAVLLAAAAGGFRLAQDHPLARITRVNAALWGDIDNDGLLDVYLCRHGPNQLWRQVKHGRWEDMTAASATANGAYDTRDGALFDADHDGDLDLFLVNGDGPNELLNNNRDGTFRPLAVQRGITGRNQKSRSLLVADLDHDRDVDIVVINARPPHEVYLNDLLWDYRPAPGFDAFRAASVAAVLAQDRDADGQLELYTLSPDNEAARWETGDDGQWHAIPLTVEAPESRTPAPGPLPSPAMALTDVDGDGASELLRSMPGGWALFRFEGEKLQLLTETGNAGLRYWLPLQADSQAGPSVVGLDASGGFSIWSPGPGRYPFIGLRFSGMEDKGQSMRSNASGIGTHAALRVDARWTLLDTFRHHSGPGQSHQPLAIGLGGMEQADFLAIEWSDGVFQSELGLHAGRLHTVTETQRQLSSCPVLFAWDGRHYAFVSDLLGVGGLGYFLEPGVYAPPRPRENFLLPADLLATKDGHYVLKIGEPMEEVAYLDAVRLAAWDLPPGWDMVLDERMGIAGPEPTGSAVFFRTQHRPVRATDRAGTDVTALVTAADLEAPPPGALDTRFIGRLREPQVLTLQFDAPINGTASATPVLVIDGWVEYPYSQTMFAAWQARAAYTAPTLEARGADGQWHTVLEQFGYPAGMPRRMSVPLAALPAGATALRLTTNQEIYWDRVAVVYAEALPAAQPARLSLQSAQLMETGFALRTTGTQHQPHYDYDRRSPFWDTRHMRGYYTAFGPVEELLAAADDAVAIIGPGEEVHLEFAADLPVLQPGWQRRFVLETNGWAKDMDLYTANGMTLEPLPVSGKPAAQREALHRQYNTRYRSGI